MMFRSKECKGYGETVSLQHIVNMKLFSVAFCFCKIHHLIIFSSIQNNFDCEDSYLHTSDFMSKHFFSHCKQTQIMRNEYLSQTYPHNRQAVLVIHFKHTILYYSYIS